MFKINNIKNKNGFTLIELLIVISVIAVLSGLMLRVINVTELNKKSRDSQRIADVRKIQTALELYFVDKRVYPNFGTYGYPNAITGVDQLTGVLKPNYINNMPVDPSNLNFQYFTSDAGKSYVIRIPLEFTLTNTCGAAFYGANGCAVYTNPL